MSKSYLKLICVTVMFVATVFIAAVPVSAHAEHQVSTGITSAKVVSFQASCHHLFVDLHGTAPATSKCIDNEVAKLRKISPNLVYVDCGSHPNALILWFDSNYQGGTICFENAGSTDMTEWNCPAPHPFCNWNDNASSYAAGCSSGTFWSDVGEEGQRQTFAARERNNFDGHNGRLPNDTLSSLTINSNC